MPRCPPAQEWSQPQRPGKSRWWSAILRPGSLSRATIFVDWDLDPRKDGIVWDVQTDWSVQARELRVNTCVEDGISHVLAVEATKQFLETFHFVDTIRLSTYLQRFDEQWHIRSFTALILLLVFWHLGQNCSESWGSRGQLSSLQGYISAPHSSSASQGLG